MRLSLVKLAKEVINVASKPGATALAKKYNYTVRQYTSLDEFHGYMWWCLTKKIDELWPLAGCFGVYCVLLTYIVWWSFQKTEIHFNRFSKHKPWEWERAQYVFEKRKKAFFNDSFMWGRIPELDKLQAEMLEVKKQRLAEEKAARHH